MKRRSAHRACCFAAALALALSGAAARPASPSTEEAGRLRGVARRARDPLQGVSERMTEAERLLGGGRLGAELESLQREILERMDALIQLYRPSEAATEQRKARSEVPGRRPGGMGTDRPVRPAEESMAGEGQWQWAHVLPSEVPEGDWAPGLPPGERQRINDTFRTGRLPGRYRQLLRQYNRRLAGAAPAVEVSEE